MSAEVTRWVRSSRCEAHNCVEVARLPDRVLVRSSRDPAGMVLRLNSTQWRAFCRALRHGRLVR